MEAIVEAEKSIARALLALGNRISARFRLKEILPEEVSLVDHAANRRPFLVVKMKDAMPDPADITKQISLPKPVKEGLLRLVTEGMERLISVANAVKEANETDEQLQDPVPEELGRDILGVIEVLRSTLERYPSPVAKDAKVEKENAMPSNLGTEAADKLKAIGALISQIAEAASPDEVMTIAQSALGEVQKFDTSKVEGRLSVALGEVSEKAEALSKEAKDKAQLDAETITKLRALGASLGALVAAYPSPTAKGADGDDNDGDDDKTQPSAPAPAADPAPASDEPPADAEPSEDEVEAVGKALEAVTSLTTAIGKRGAKMSGARLKKLRAAFSTIKDLLDEIDPDVAKRIQESTPRPPAREPGASSNVSSGGPADTPQGADESEALAEVMKAIEKMEKRLDKKVADLNTKVEKSLEAPAPPASHPGGDGEPSQPRTRTNGARGKRARRSWVA